MTMAHDNFQNHKVVTTSKCFAIVDLLTEVQRFVSLLTTLVVLVEDRI